MFMNELHQVQYQLKVCVLDISFKRTCKDIRDCTVTYASGRTNTVINEDDHRHSAVTSDTIAMAMASSIC